MEEYFIMLALLVGLAYVLEALLVSLGIWRGYKLGLFKGLVRTVYLVCIIPISILIARGISHPVATKILSLITSGSNPTINSLVQASPETFVLIEALTASIIFSISFAILFGIIGLISLIKFNAIASKITNKFDNEKNASLKKWGGVGIGLVNGVLSAAIALIPICLIISTLGTPDTAALNSLHIPTDTQENIHHEKTYYVALPSSLLLRTVTHISDKDIPEEYSQLKHHNLNFVDEAPDIINEAGYALLAYKNSHDHGKDSKQSILDAIGAANAHDGDSQVLPAIFANLIKKAAEAWEHGESFLGIDLNFNNAIAKAFVSKTLAALKNVDSNNVHSVVDTLMGDGEHEGIMTNVFILQEKTKTNMAGNTTATILKENSELVADTLVQLGKDEDLQSVNDLVADIGSEYMSEVFGDIFVDNDNNDKVNNFADKIINYAKENDDLKSNSENYEEYVSSVSQIIEDTANSYNYPITDSESIIVSVGLISYLSQAEPDEMTAESLLNYFGVNLNQ